ncbi:hypothetical protein BLSTO_04243 [Blastocystis sp. subtype 1]
MPLQQRLGVCSLCHEPLGLLQGKKCAVCGRVVCQKCCVRERGVNAIFRNMNGKPIVLCNPCLAVREATLESSNPADDSHVMEQSTKDEWCEGLLLNRITLSKDASYGNIHSSVFTVELPLSYASQYSNTPITITLVNDVVVTLLLPSCSSSYMSDEWMTLHHPLNHTRLYLNIKYLFLSSDHPEANPALLQEFQQLPLRSNVYLRLFPLPPILDRSEDKNETQGPSPLEEESARSLSIAFVPSFALFVFLWRATKRFPRWLRITVIPLLTTALIVLYPFLQQ